MKRLHFSEIVISLFLIFTSTSVSQPSLEIFDKWEVGEYLATVIFSPDGKSLATAARSVVVTLNAADPESKARLQITLGTPISSKIYNIAYSPKGQYLAGASTDGNIFIWDALKFDFNNPSTYNSIQKLSGHNSKILSLTFSPDGKYLACAGADSTIIIWDVLSWTSTKKITGHHGTITALAFSPGGKYLASCSSRDDVTFLWNTATWTESKKFRNEMAGKSFYELAFSPDGKFLAGATSEGISEWVYIWDMGNMTELTNFTPYVDLINDLQFSPDGGHLIIASFDQFLSFYDTRSWEEELKEKGINEGAISNVSFHPSGNYIAFGNGGEAFIAGIDPPMAPGKNAQVQDKKPIKEAPVERPKRK